MKNIAKATIAFAISIVAMVNTSTEVKAQDLIARQALTDKKMKVDSVVINKRAAVKKVQEVNYENTGLYTTWETKSVHCYGGQQTPDRYRIDLRGFAMPTPSKVVTSNFGYRASFGRMHKGIDVKVYIGDTIVSAFDGKVRIVNYEAKGYGNYVVIRHNNGLETIYGHLSKHLCKTGDVVKAGQPIGLGGNTGRSTGSHLHFETRILGEAINPALLFNFAKQNVTCDFYDYKRGSKSSSSATASARGNSNSKATATKSNNSNTATAKASKSSSVKTATAHAKNETPAKAATAKAETTSKQSSTKTQATSSKNASSTAKASSSQGKEDSKKSSASAKSTSQKSHSESRKSA